MWVKFIHNDVGLFITDRFPCQSSIKAMIIGWLKGTIMAMDSPPHDLPGQQLPSALNAHRHTVQLLVCINEYIPNGVIHRCNRVLEPDVQQQVPWHLIR